MPALFPALPLLYCGPNAKTQSHFQFLVSKRHKIISPDFHGPGGTVITAFYFVRYVYYSVYFLEVLAILALITN